MEKRKKFKILKRILPIICAVLCIATALTTPIGAVINSSQGGYNNFDITARSTWPLTVGFSYVTRDLSTGSGASYVYSTYVGQYGQEFNDTLEGNEQYVLEYDPYGNGSTTYNVTGKLTYELFQDSWRNPIDVGNGSFRYGRKRIAMSNNTPESGNTVGFQQGVVLRADDIVFNPWSMIDPSKTQYQTSVVAPNVTITTIIVYPYDDLSYAIPSFLSPETLEYTQNLGIEMTYSWSADVVAQDGSTNHVSGTNTYDNRDNGYVQQNVPIMDFESLLGRWTDNPYVSNTEISDTVIIENYYGYIEYKYYNYISPTSLEGSWKLNDTLIDVTGERYYTLEYGDDAQIGFSRFFTYHEGSAIVDRPLLNIGFRPGASAGNIFLLGLDKHTTVHYYTDGSIAMYDYDYDRITPISSQYYNSIRNFTIYDGFEQDYYDYWWDEFYIDVELGLMTEEELDFYIRSQLNFALLFLNTNATKTTLDIGEYVGWEEVERSESAEFTLFYPLLDTSNIVNDGSDVYEDYFDKYSMPNFKKWIHTTVIDDNYYDTEIDFTSWIGTAVGGFLNMELMPNFAIGGILAILVAFSIVMLFLKFFAGG